MKRWPLVIAIIYAAIFLSLTVPFTILAFYPMGAPFGESARDIVNAYMASWGYWLWLVIMVISQFALLSMPVAVEFKRPVATRPLYLTVLASSLLLGVLAGGVLLAVGEIITNDALYEPMWYTSLALFLLSWFFWASVFRRWSEIMESKAFIDRQIRYLFAGSVLELLVAVPAHVIARSKDYCCAGYATFVGMALGFSVMIISFGPGIFYLYRARFKKIRPERK